MTTQQKVIRAKVGLLELAKQLATCAKSFRLLLVQPGRANPAMETLSRHSFNSGLFPITMLNQTNRFAIVLVLISLLPVRVRAQSGAEDY
jgi:hypothetical protein